MVGSRSPTGKPAAGTVGRVTAATSRSAAAPTAPYRLEHSNVVVMRAHSVEACPVFSTPQRAGTCPVHWRTDGHPMRKWAQTWTEEFGFGRVCPEHGTVYPDPDDTGSVWPEHMTAAWAAEACDCGLDFDEF